MPFPLLRLARDVRSEIARVPRVHSGAQVVSGLLAIGLAVQAASTTVAIVSLMLQKPPDHHGIRHVRPIESVASSVAALANANLFGAAPAANTLAAISVSNSPLVLTGTIALTDPTRGFAILGKDRLTPRMHPVGSAVAEGVTLHEVYTDHVIVDRGGRLEAVWMPKSSLLTQQLTAAVIRAPNVNAALPTEAPMSPDVREHLDYENARVGAAFTESALTDHDQFRGLVVQAGPDPSILGQMGLKPGDVVMGVDSINIDLDNVGLLRKSLASGRKIVLNIIRPREGPIDLPLDSAQYQGLVNN